MDVPNKESIVWRVPEWIQAFGGLTTENVLEYFSTSPFYDRQSNNQVLKMQSQFNALGLGDLNQRLSLMRGTEFVVHAEYAPDMWIIRKQRRNSPEDVVPLAYYFVVNENIYPSSDIYSIFASRLLSASHSLRKALSAVQSLHLQQESTAPKPAQTNALQEREGEMIQALQSTLRVLQTERTRNAQEANKMGQGPPAGKKSERDSASPTEMRSPKARRRKSKAL